MRRKVILHVPSWAKEAFKQGMTLVPKATPSMSPETQYLDGSLVEPQWYPESWREEIDEDDRT
jgi:hypothetical protein